MESNIRMLRWRQYGEVFGPIVRFVSIDVMYVLGWFKWPTEHFLHYKTMNSDMFPINIFTMIAICIYPALTLIFLWCQSDSWITMNEIAAVMFLAKALGELFSFTAIYRAFSGLGTPWAYLGLLGVSSGSQARIMHSTQPPGIRWTPTILNAANCPALKQPGSLSNGIMSITKAAFCSSRFTLLTFQGTPPIFIGAYNLGVVK